MDNFFFLLFLLLSVKPNEFPFFFNFEFLTWFGGFLRSGGRSNSKMDSPGFPDEGLRVKRSLQQPYQSKI
jgi:hypothetical protein